MHKPHIVTVVVALPGEKPVAVEIENSLQGFQAQICGGYLEKLGAANLLGTPLEGFDVLFDEDGTQKSLAFIRWLYGFGLVGPIIVTKATPDGEWR